MPATDTIEFEHEFEDLVRELRALPAAAPEEVRGRVRALGEPAVPSRPWDRLHDISIRRSLLVLAPACALPLLPAAGGPRVPTSGPNGRAPPRHRAAAHPGDT